MKIDRFGLGAWWPRPEQAAVGGLDHLPADQWPMLAAKWLAAGFDSPLLRQLAELQGRRRDTGLPAEDGLVTWAAPRGLATSDPSGAGVPVQFRVALQAVDLMPEVMRSIGFDPVLADEEFLARCQSALDIVQHDLDVKVRQIEEFIDAHDKVRITVVFRGREMQHRDLGFKLLMSIQEKLVLKAAVEQAPMPDRNRLVMTLIPKPH